MIKETLIISGKGGAGKTTLTASLAYLRRNVIVADSDVDAPDLHLLLKPGIKEKIDFKGGEIAVIDGEKCTGCGACVSVCPYGAISGEFTVDPVSCDGCGVCEWNCPPGAISMKEVVQGASYTADIPQGKMVYAVLNPGEENSGKLVAVIKKKAREIAEKEGMEEILIDGAPGIGCPVIASLAGVFLAVIVTEPTVSGIHDLKRIIGVANHFGAKSRVVINKVDLSAAKVAEIEEFCVKEGLEILGRIPFSREFTRSLRRGITIMAYAPESAAAKAIKEISEKLGGENG